MLHIRRENNLWFVYRFRGIMWFAVGVGFDIPDAWQSAKANEFVIRRTMPARAFWHLNTERIHIESYS